MAEINKIYYVKDEDDYKFLMEELENEGYSWWTSFDDGDNKPTTDKFTPEWTWGFPIFVYLYDDKTIAYEPTEEDEDSWGLPEEYMGMIEKYFKEYV